MSVYSHQRRVKNKHSQHNVASENMVLKSHQGLEDVIKKSDQNSNSDLDCVIHNSKFSSNHNTSESNRKRSRKERTALRIDGEKARYSIAKPVLISRTPERDMKEKPAIDRIGRSFKLERNYNDYRYRKLKEKPRAYGPRLENEYAPKNNSQLDVTPC